MFEAIKSIWNFITGLGDDPVPPPAAPAENVIVMLEFFPNGYIELPSHPAFDGQQMNMKAFVSEFVINCVQRRLVKHGTVVIDFSGVGYSSSYLSHLAEQLKNHTGKTAEQLLDMIEFVNSEDNTIITEFLEYLHDSRGHTQRVMDHYGISDRK